MANIVFEERTHYTGTDNPADVRDDVFCRACEQPTTPMNIGGEPLDGGFRFAPSRWVSRCCEDDMIEIVGCGMCGADVHSNRPPTAPDGYALCSPCAAATKLPLPKMTLVDTLVAEIERITAECLSQWDKHFARYYTKELAGDHEKRAGIRVGVASLRDDLLRELGRVSR